MKQYDEFVYDSSPIKMLAVMMAVTGTMVIKPGEARVASMVGAVTLIEKRLLRRQ